MRTAEISRQTNETQIEIKLDLDGTGKHEISTGVGFLDHMLTHLAVHGLFDLNVQATGDLHIDSHHTVEDVALALGQAFDQALGDRKGIIRMGDCFAPMDETLAHVAIDLSGRPYAVSSSRMAHAIYRKYSNDIVSSFLRVICRDFTLQSPCTSFIWSR